MGFMDKLRAELVDIVEWFDDSQHTIVWRFPRYHNEIKQGAQLIVRPGQVVVFVSQGQIADIFGPGRYSLQTDNLPVLSTILGWKYGFNSPFRSEVYFVNTTQITDLKWGTPNPVMMRDPDFGPVRVRAFGNYTLKAMDPKILITELVGTDSVYEADEISELLRSIINTAFADVVSSSGIAVLDLATQYQELSEKLREAVVEQVDDEYGLEIPMLQIVNISLPAEVEKALDARTSMGVIGDMAQYQAFQMGQAMPVAAANPAGGLAGAGVGLGMGMAMAGPMMRQTGSAEGYGAPGPQAPAPPPPLPSWHIAENGQSMGPFTPTQLAEAVTASRVRPDTLVWSAGMSGWSQASQVPELAALFRVVPPPPIG
jgi:membrane protease subunit (stomatin/prohibitin family)